MHDANMLDQQGMGHGPRTLTLWQVGAVCTEREPTGRVLIVIVAEKEEREDKREESREREREKERRKNGRREKEKGTREREGERGASRV